MKLWTRHNLSEFIDANSAVLLKNTMRLSHKYLMRNESEGRNDLNYELHKQGLKLLLESKAAIVLVVNNKDTLQRGFETDSICVGRHEPVVNQFQELLLDCKRFLKVRTICIFTIIFSSWLIERIPWKIHWCMQIF